MKLYIVQQLCKLIERNIPNDLGVTLTAIFI